MHTQKISETPLDFAEAIKEDIKSSKYDGVLKCVQCRKCVLSNMSCSTSFQL